MNSENIHHSSDRFTAELLGFAGFKRRFYYDQSLNATMVWVGQGDYYVSQNPNEVLTTILGSCVAVCVRDPDLKLGGINHFLLPEAAVGASSAISNDLRYGSYSVERLINSIMSHGGRRDHLEIKIFGGAAIGSDFSTIGGKNADFVENYFAREGLPVTAKDLRGGLPRRLVYYPSTGKAMIGLTRDVEAGSIFDIERKIATNNLAERDNSQPVLF